MAHPVEPADRPLLERLQAASLALLGRQKSLADWAYAPSTDDHHTWVGDACVTRLILLRRPRARHVGLLIHAGLDGDHASLAAAVRFADRWTPVDRLELALPADATATAAALALGFQRVSRRIGRLDDGRDEVLLDRLRPGFSPRSAASIAVPPRQHLPLPAHAWRPLHAGDAAAVHALSTSPTGLAGTLQVPSANVAYYAERFTNTPPGNQVRVLDSEHGVLAITGAHPTEFHGVFSLGMTVSERWQGIGVGRLALDHAIALALAAGARRIELAVYSDNDRALRLYQRAGFVVEGERRFDMLRDGGHASTIEMRRDP